MSFRRLTAVRTVTGIALALALAFAALGFVRYSTFANRTFDLAFYARMAWGLVRFDFWDPILGANVLGLHLSPVLVPIGALGAVLGTPLALLLSQGLALGLATLPLARIGRRHLGPSGAFAGLALVLHPNVGHVLSYEAHPGTLAVLPLAWLAEALDRRDARTLFYASLGVLACREDLALVVALACLVLAATSASSRRAALSVFAMSLAYLAFFVVFLHPRFRPPEGSLELHFGSWGRSLGEVVVAWLTHPREVLAHLGAPARLSYLPRVMAPLLLLPLLSPRNLVVAAPILGIALMSVFPTTTKLESHYLTPALPFLVAGALASAGRIATVIARRRGATVESHGADAPSGTSANVLSVALVAASFVASLVAGVLSPMRDAPDFVLPELDPASARRLLAHVPARASIQAPDRFLPHVAERPLFFRGAPPDRGADFQILDLTHRSRYAHSEDLLRTTEEPFARSTFARTDLVLVDHTDDYALFRKGTSTHEARIAPIRAPRATVGAVEADAGSTGVRLTSCLSLLSAVARGHDLELVLRAHGACPNDLAVRLREGSHASRVDLLFDGLVSPSSLREGDFVVSRHALRVAPGARLFVGVLRSSGARPEPDDPTAVQVSVR